MLKYIITGTGRCGTTYISQLVTKYIGKCGHERVFHPLITERSLLTALLCSDYVADSSWLAVPWLYHTKLRKVPVIHIVRNPAAVISSFISHNVYANIRSLTVPPYAHRMRFAVYAAKHLPALRKLPDLEAGIRWYIEWNTRIMACKEHRDYRLVHLEKMPSEFFDCFKLPRVTDTLDTVAYNVGRHTVRLTNADFQTSPKYEELRQLSVQLGYDISQ